MPTADRTTIRAAVDALVGALRTNLTAGPPTASKPFWKVEVGDAGAEAFPRPHLTLRLLRARVVTAVDDDRVFALTLETRIATDVSASDPHGAMLDKIAALEDYLDTVRDTGLIAGAEGLDDRVWTFQYPRTTSGARTATASAEQTLVVKVQRTFNRTAAP